MDWAAGKEESGFLKYLNVGDMTVLGKGESIIKLGNLPRKRHGEEVRHGGVHIRSLVRFKASLGYITSSRAAYTARQCAAKNQKQQLGVCGALLNSQAL